MEQTDGVQAVSAPKFDAGLERAVRARVADGHQPSSESAAAMFAEIGRLRAALAEAHTLAAARQTACDELRRERDALVAHQNEMGRRDTVDRRFELVKAFAQSGEFIRYQGDNRCERVSGEWAVRLADEALAALSAPKAGEVLHVCARDPLDVIAREYVEFMAERIDEGYARENADSSSDIGHLSILHRYHVARREAQEREAKR